MKIELNYQNLTVSNNALTLPPKTPTASAIVAAIKKAIIAYSTEVAPFSL
jgi:hypothetical protein